MSESAPLEEPAGPAPKLQLSLADFELLRRIGDGSYSHVVLARHRGTGLQYALKVIDKQYILRHKVVEYIKQERAILDSLAGVPGVAPLHFTFQDAFSLYLGLEYCPNGELYDQIRLRGQLEPGAARAYAAEVVLILGHLRAHGVVHRDLKPENLLLDAEGHLQLIDFGSAKQLPLDAVAPKPPAAAEGGAAAAEAGAGGAAEAAAEGSAAGAGAENGAAEPGDRGDSEQPPPQQQQQQAADGDGDGAAADAATGAAAADDAESKRAVSLVGTADYVSPEILRNEAVTCAADLWALGCVLYQMLVGKPPFKTPSEYLTFQRIVEADYDLPPGLDPDAADLIARLLQLQPAKRIGAADLAELRAHPLFAGVDWGTLRSQPAPEFLQDDELSLSTRSSFDWELESLASALPHAASDDPLPHL